MVGASRREDLGRRSPERDKDDNLRTNTKTKTVAGCGGGEGGAKEESGGATAAAVRLVVARPSKADIRFCADWYRRRRYRGAGTAFARFRGLSVCVSFLCARSRGGKLGREERKE